MLGALRLVLAAAGVSLAIALGVRTPVALVTAVVAAAFCAFAVISSRQGRPRLVASASAEPAWRVALRATYPSTIGLTALTIAGLVIKPQLAAFTGGLLAALGALALVAAAQVGWWNRVRPR